MKYKIEKLQTNKTVATVLKTLDTFVKIAIKINKTLSACGFGMLDITIFSGNFCGLIVTNQNLEEKFINKHDRRKNCEREYNENLSLLINFI